MVAKLQQVLLFAWFLTGVVLSALIGVNLKPSLFNFTFLQVLIQGFKQQDKNFNAFFFSLVPDFLR